MREYYNYKVITDDGMLIHVYGWYNSYAPYAQGEQHIDKIPVNCFADMA